MMPAAVAVEEPDVRVVVACLAAGEVFTALAVDRVEERAAALEAVLAHVADGDTRVAWVGNPLRSALTIERMLMQLVGPEIDLRFDRTPAELARLFAARVEDESRLLLVVQQPETMDPATRETLGRMARHLNEQPVRLQFLFAGSSTLRLPEIPSEPPNPDLAPVAASSSAARSRIRIRWPRESAPVAALVGAALLALVAMSSTAVQQWRQDFSRLPAAMAHDAPQPMHPAATRLAFDGLFAGRTAPPLSTTEKDALFDEFMARLRQPPKRP